MFRVIKIIIILLITANASNAQLRSTSIGTGNIVFSTALSDSLSALGSLTIASGTGIPMATSSGSNVKIKSLAGTSPITMTNTNDSTTTASLGTIGLANGGTNNASLSATQGNVYYGDGTKIVSLSPGTAGQILQTGGAGANPSWITNTGGAGLADPGANGVVVRTALNTTTARTITGTSNRLTVTDGTGVSGNPTLDVVSTSSATASRIMERDANGNTGIKNLNGANYTTTATAAGTTTLTAASTSIQYFSGTTTQTVVMPDATTLAAGMQYQILNNSTGSLTVNKNGGTLIKTVVSGASVILTVMDISTSAGVYEVEYSTDLTIGDATGSTLSLTGAATQLTIGVNSATLGKIKLFGNTSGDATIQPAAVAGSGTVVTLPNASSTLPIYGQQITNTGFSAARTITWPDASISVARTDAAQTVTGIQTNTGVTGETGLIENTQYSIVNSDFTLSAASGVQNCFPTDRDVWTLAGSTTYFVQGNIVMTTGTTTTKTTALAFGGTATMTSVGLMVDGWNAVPGTAATAQGSTAMTALTSTVITATATTAGVQLRFSGYITVNAGGTFIPQINFSANPGGTNLVKAGSWIKVINAGTTTFRGNVN